MSTWDSEQDDLGSILTRLRGEIDDLTDVVEDLPGRMGTLGAQMEQVRRTMGELGSRTDEADAHVRELAALVKRLDARVEWLERNIRLHDPAAVVVELDDAGPDLLHLAELADAGQRAQLGLMPAATRSRLEADVTAHAEAVRNRARQLQAALTASRTLAGTPLGEDDHVEAIGEFRLAVGAMAEAVRRARELARDAVEAAEELAADDDRRTGQAAVIERGDRAWTELLARLRARVAEAVGEGALLPTWFTTVLGPIPPAQDTRAWMDAATTLLAYRVTYGVTDPIVALGPEPVEADGSRRRAWHHGLRRQLRDLQR